MRLRRSGRHLAAALASAGATLALGATDASAQGFLDFLFGGGPKYPQQSQNPGQPGMLTPGGKPYQFPSSAPSRGSDDDRSSLSNYGSYKTICVRTCDGYYFPISASTTRKGFARDEARCQASCGGGARLFHVPANQSTVDDAVDSDGRAYAAMKTAFLYRKHKVEGCQCRSAPWSEAEQSRHRAYADAEEAAKPREQPSQEKQKIATAETAKAKPEAAKKPDAESQPSDTKIPAEAVPVKRTAKATAKSRIAAEKSAAKAPPVYVKPPQGQGPVPITMASQAKAPTLGNPMGLGGGTMQWPGDAPPPQAYPRKRN